MLAIINRIVSETSRAPTLVEALTLIVDHISDTLDTDACSIFLADDESGEYVLLASQGLNSALVGKARVKFGEGLIGLVGEREEPFNIDSAHEHPHYLSYPKLEEQDFSAFLGIPIIYRAHLQGVLVVQQTEKTPFRRRRGGFFNYLDLATEQ